MKRDLTFWRAMATVAAGCLFADAARAQVNQNIGNLAPGESVTITFDVTIDSPLPASVTQLSAQGAVTHDGGILNTDDPDTVAANDATITPLALDFDFGDAPDPTYPTLRASDGARHFIPQGGATLFLGTNAPDAETDGQPNATATGDNTAGTNDEDSVTFPAGIVAGQAYTATVVVTGTGGILSAWMDWDRDGDWNDAGEQIVTNLAVSAGPTPLNLTAAVFATGGTALARFRLSTQSSLAPTGQADDGEVEDYEATLVVNVAPVANADNYTVAEGGTLNQTDGRGATTPGDPNDDGVLANDTDANGDILTATIVAPPTNASSFSLNAGGSFTYTHNGGETTSDSFTYRASDGLVDSGIATVNITVTAVNDPVTAIDDVLADVAEDSGLRVITFAALLSNDSPGTGETGQTLTITAVGSAVGGSVQINGLNVEFTPAPNAHGPASFEYTAQDDGAPPNTDTATASFNLTPVADTPSVTGATTLEGQQTSAGLAISRNAADNAEVTHFKITAITGGSLFQNDGTTAIASGDFITFAQGNAGLKFTPTAGLFSPATTFEFDVQASTSSADVGLGGGVVTATITVTPRLDFGDAPDAPYPTLLAGDGARHVVLSTGATLYLGSIPPDIESDGQPNAGATGDGADEDGITLPASFRAGLSSNVTVSVTGSGGILNAWIDWNADGDWSDAGEQIATNLSVSAGPNVLSAAAPGAAPSAGSFARFRLSTQGGLAPTGQAIDGEVEDHAVTLETNLPPVAVADSLGTRQATAVIASVAKLLVNDSDSDGDGLTISAVSATSTNGGSVVLGAGQITYTPLPALVGEDRFTYTLSDGRGGTALGTVVVTVTSTNAPSANQVSITVTAGGRQVRFAGIPGQNYVVQSADAVTGPWSDLSPPIAAGATGLIEYEDTTLPVPGTRFYRTVVAP